MKWKHHANSVAWLALVMLVTMAANAQTLTITNGIQTYSSLANTTVTMTGHSELHVTAAANPIPGCLINLDSPDAWFFLEGIRPSVVVSSYLSQLRVNGVVAVSGVNVRVVSYAMGSVVIPHAQSYQPLQVFTGAHFTGASNTLSQYAAYSDANLGVMANAISSFILKRGYEATFAQNANGTGLSRNFVAQDGDLNVGVMPPGLDDSISFVRVFPWRWTGKKGVAGDIAPNLNVRWYYNWNLNQNSTPDLEYVPIRQTRYWPDLNQNWRTRGATQLLGYNEPDHTDQANLTVPEAISSWPDLLATGLRVGAPAVSDGGLSWLYSFMDQANAAGLRVDFVPVHYYRCYGNAADPDGATTQLYNFLKGIHDRVHRPIWLTEWNNGANWTTCADPTFAQQQATIAKMIEMLDNTPFVERYAIYNWVEDVRRVEWDDGSLTAAGVTYRDKVSPPGYVQEGLPGGGRSIACYQFEDNVLDSSGFENNCIAVGIPDYPSGRYGQAVHLDGTNSYVQLPSNTAHSAGFSFAAWVLWEGGGSWQRIFDFGNDTSQYLFLTPSSGNGTLRFAIKNGGGEQLIETSALPVGQWRHVAVTLDGNLARLYVNGAQVASSTSMTIAPSQFNPTLNYLGKSQFPADPLFRGRLDEVLIAPYALTPAEIAALQTNQVPEFPDVGDGIWSANADGDWSDAAKWSGGLPANGAGYTADFSTVNITGNRTIILDSSRSIGTLKFGDTSGSQSWTLAPGGTNVLTLDSASAAQPTIDVANTATLDVSLAGVNGFVKSGPGTLILGASNSLSGVLNLDRGIDGNNDDGVTRIAHPQALGNVSALNIRNTSVSTAGGATLQLDGSAGNIVITQPVSVSCRNNSTTPTIENLAGTNTIASLVSLNVGGNMFNIRSDAGLLIFSGANQYVGSLTAGRTYAFSGAGNFLVSGPILNSANGAPITLTKSGAGTLTLAAVNTYGDATTVSGGALQINGVIGPGPVAVSGAILGGNGTIRGAVTMQTGSVLSPGANSIGRLTVNNSVTLQAGSTTLVEISKTPFTNDQLRVSSTLTYGGALVVTNLGGTLEAGDSFTLFQAGTFNGSFSSLSLPPLNPGLGWNTNALTSGVLSVVQTVETSPPNLTSAVAPNGVALSFSWPSDHIGWRMETNAVGLNSPESWFTLDGSVETNQVFVPISPASSNVFIRLVFP